MSARKDDYPGSDFSGQRHDQCLHPKEWREIHEFMAGTGEYRKHLDRKIDDLAVNLDKEIANLRSIAILNYEKNEKRIRALERFRWMVAGALTIVTAVLIPVAMAVIK